MRLARPIKSSDVDVAVMTLTMARAIGAMCAANEHPDVIDVHVALCPRERHHAVVTSNMDEPGPHRSRPAADSRIARIPPLPATDVGVVTGIEHGLTELAYDAARGR